MPNDDYGKMNTELDIFQPLSYDDLLEQAIDKRCDEIAHMFFLPRDFFSPTNKKRTKPYVRKPYIQPPRGAG